MEGFKTTYSKPPPHAPPAPDVFRIMDYINFNHSHCKESNSLPVTAVNRSSKHPKIQNMFCKH